jgi:hypothetical protein
VLLFAAVLSALGAALALIDLRPSSPSATSALTSIFFLAGWFLTLSTPLLTAMVASNLTTRMVRSQDFDLVYVTSLSNRSVVSGQVFSVLYRLRVYLMVQASLIPLLALGSFSALMSVKVAVVGLGAAPARITVYGRPGAPWEEILIPALLVVAVLVMLWNMNLLAVTTGVRVVLLREAPLWSGPSAMMFILGLTIFFCTVPVFLLGIVEPFNGYTTLQVFMALIGDVVLAFLPALMALSDARWTAQRWAR